MGDSSVILPAGGDTVPLGLTVTMLFVSSDSRIESVQSTTANTNWLDPDWRMGVVTCTATKMVWKASTARLAFWPSAISESPLQFTATTIPVAGVPPRVVSLTLTTNGGPLKMGGGGPRSAIVRSGCEDTLNWRTRALSVKS